MPAPPHPAPKLSDQAREAFATPAEVRPGKREQKEHRERHVDRPPSTALDGTRCRLKGHLDSRWAAWFDGLTLTHDSDGTTIIHGPVADQAALHGLLQKVRDLGLPLVSVTQVEPDQPDAPAIEPR